MTDVETSADLGLLGVGVLAEAIITGLAAISQWLTAQGVSAADTTRYVAAIFAPLGETLSPPPDDLMTLAGEHATKGGINEQFHASLRRAGVFEAVERSLDEIAARLRQ